MRIALALVGLMVVVACGESGSGDSDSTVAETPGSTIAAPTDGVSTTDTELGTILVDGDGFTLYVFTQDTDGESVCYDDCAALWPPVPADTQIAGALDASMFGSTTRTDGSEQLTVNGMPLYLYTPDTNPGDVIGQGFGGVWFVVDADGRMIGGPEAATDAEEPAADYGY